MHDYLLELSSFKNKTLSSSQGLVLKGTQSTDRIHRNHFVNHLTSTSILFRYEVNGTNKKQFQMKKMVRY